MPFIIMNPFVHTAQITSPDILVEELAKTSKEVKRLQKEADFGDPDTKKLAKSKLYRIAETILEARRINNAFVK